MTAYAELQITSNFSFLRGGSHPEELVLRAAELGLVAIALTDRNTLAGVVRAHVAAKEVGIRFVVGARLDLMPEDNRAARPASAEAIADSELGTGVPNLLGRQSKNTRQRRALDPRTRQSLPHAGDIVAIHGMDPRVEPGNGREENALSRSSPSSSSPDASNSFTVDDSLTTSAPGSAPHAMVGIRAPASGKPRRADSHHSLRPDSRVPSLGKQRVNAATEVHLVEGHESAFAPVAGNAMASRYLGSPQGTTGPPSSCPDALRPSPSPSRHLAPADEMAPQALESGPEMSAGDESERGAPANRRQSPIAIPRPRGRGARHGKTPSTGGAADGHSLLCFPTDRAAYGRLSELISLGQRRAEKGQCELWLEDVLAQAEGQILVALPPERIDREFKAFLKEVRSALTGPCYLAAPYLYRGDDGARIEALAELAAACGTPLVAAGDVLYHTPARRPLQDVLACIREHTTIDEAGYLLEANAERHLKPLSEMARLFARHPEALARTLEIVDACRFSLDELRYEYPIDPAPDGLTVQEHLERLTWQGAAARYPGGIPDKVRELLEHEFALIAELGYAPYFLTVHDIVRFARSRGILCQGRGSAANSAVCYCLGITAVDPGRFDLLFERFVSAERNEPPDIDVDFEHERREEVIQYVYEKYGREHAGIAATVIHYRARSAIREVGKALGLSEDAVGALASGIWGWSEGGLDARLARERGLDPAAPRLRQALELAGELTGFPRHLSQHVGGFVLTRSRLDQVVPVVNAAMAERTMVEWDKDDLDALGILKIDVLALGMLTCVRKAFELLERHYGRKLDLTSVPPEDPAVYDMLGRADSIGVFQVESRAQMTMLPRLRPRCFYDLVIEVAIVRPGPIQGDMVHPYLRRRSGLEAVAYPSTALKGVLEKTLGVPLFQEQAMQIAIVGAGFTPSESDRLRRAMATFKRVGTIHTFRDKFIAGMVNNGYERAFAERCFQQIEGFGTYGFPESHAASFALLVYVSSWLKCHYPEAFACALLNSQPMGFYAPAQIVRDARDHGVTVLPVDVNRSDWDCTLEPEPQAASAGPPPASAPPGSNRDGPMDDMSTDGPFDNFSTIRAARSAAPARVGVRAPAAEKPRRSDSHHNLRHDPTVAADGEQQVNGATAIPEAEGRAAPHGASVPVATIIPSIEDGAAPHGASVPATLGVAPPVPGIPAIPADVEGMQAGHEDGRGGVSRRRALRLGFRQVKGLQQEETARLVAARAGGYADLADLRRRAGVSATALDRLARADAFQSMTLDRRGAIWRAIGLDRTGHELDLPPLFAWAEGRTAPAEPGVVLPRMTLGQEVAEDYANLRLTLRCHPLALLRPWLGPRVVKAERLAEIDDGRRVEVAGLALVRQRPGTASGVIFITIEDESGVANLVVWPAVFERFRRVVLGAQLLAVRGKVQKEGRVIHVVADTLIDRTDLLRRLAATDHALEAPVARADRVKRPSDSGRRRSAPPFEAPLAHADHAKNSGPPDPRDPGHRSRRERLLDQLGKHEAPFAAPVARADELKRNTKNVRELHPKAPGFKSRDFH
ncbi:MAG TPA: error-prone DNA polymerase [Geminicoccaceae bacterium]|nr:error-prone DNA polymerase [Geminicoccaceae bacterium]